MPVDPFRGKGDPTRRRVLADDTLEAFEERRPALVARARKRVVEWGGGDSWVIAGDHKLGDTYDEYIVHLVGRKYHCSCYDTAHGETRARRLCSHVLAVLLWRREHPERTTTSRGSDVAREEETSPDDDEPVLPPADTQVAPAHVMHEPSETDVEAWSPTDERLTPKGWEPVPAWATSYREAQWRAAIETVEAFENGARVVFADMPTGSGKTLYGDLVSRLMQQPAIYMCTTKTLQDQVLEDFPYARVLKGRANYPTMFESFPQITCDDCDGNPENNDCTYCQPMHQCAYRRAKAQAIRSQLAVVNCAYWLREANFVGAFSLPPDPELPANPRAGARRRREGGLFIVDECDTIEDQLLSFVEFALTKRRLRELQLDAPKKGSHKNTVKTWMDEELFPAIQREMRKAQSMGGVEGMRRFRGWETLKGDSARVSASIMDENWIRDYGREEQVPFAFKPVRVDDFGNQLLWKNMGRTVMMSATIISPEEMARSLGYDGEYAVVRAPMMFPIENRRIRVAPVANMTNKTEDAERPKLLKAISKIIEKHPGDRVLIHSVSYYRADAIRQHLLSTNCDRPVFSYRNAEERERVLADYLEAEAAVLIAPSFERGVDLKDDACRVQIVAKVPYPNLGDPRTSARAHGPDGDAWMAVQTIRSLVQMTGRAVRTETDYCETYILDAQFAKNLQRRNKSLLPTWWRDALDNSFKVKDLL
jgi:ATP-dependent DNA helicase DinG